jgi:hypothetical protein
MIASPNGLNSTTPFAVRPGSVLLSPAPERGDTETEIKEK